MIPLFDYRNINDHHKEAAEECAKLIENQMPSVAALIRERFEISQPKRIPIESSEFCNKIKEFGIHPAQQGYMIGPDGVQIPMVAICADINQLDQFLQNLSSKDK